MKITWQNIIHFLISFFTALGTALGVTTMM